jgi:hypothetical protein
MKKINKESNRDVHGAPTSIERRRPALHDAPTVKKPSPEKSSPAPVELPGDIETKEDLENVVVNKIKSAPPEPAAFLDILGFINKEYRKLGLSEEEKSYLRRMVHEKARELKLLEELKKLELMQENKDLKRWKKLAGILK